MKSLEGTEGVDNYVEIGKDIKVAKIVTGGA